MTEHRARKDQLIEAMLPEVAFDGWSRTALRAGARKLGLSEAEAEALLPGGAAAMVTAFSDWADRRMLAALSPQPLDTMRVRDRVAAGVLARLTVLDPHREAVRRALSVLAMPQNAPLGLKLLYRTVDAIWYAAGDTATDWNFYTKRGLLAGVYATTTLYWLDDRSPGSMDTYGFLERRLDDVMAFPKITSRIGRAVDILPNPLRFFSVARRR